MILLYHHIAPPDVVPRCPDPRDGWQFTHAPAVFERQLLQLRDRGYRFLSLAALLDEIDQLRSDPLTVSVTFDDGWLDTFTDAMPILVRLCIPATCFTTTAHLQPGASDPRKMTRAQLRDIQRAGLTIGSHTRSHPDLTALPPDLACAELTGSRADLEQLLGVPIPFFAYPGGAFNRRVVQLVAETGYTAACSALGPAPNHPGSRLWLFRDVLTGRPGAWADRARLCQLTRRLLAWRVYRRLRAQLARVDCAAP